jgi:SepF-like predicted cell division protein (DUF552 family)
MFNNIISQIASSISSSSRDSNDSFSNNKEQTEELSQPKVIIKTPLCNKRNRATRSADVTPEQDTKKLKETNGDSEPEQSESDNSDFESSSSKSDTEGTKNFIVTMDESRLLEMLKTQFKESEDRMAYMITTKLKPIEESIRKFSLLEAKLVSLQKENERLHQELQKNNIIVFGIPEISGETTDVHKVIEGLSNSLKIAQIDYNDAFRIRKYNKDKARPLLIKLLRYRDKQAIFNAAKNLKGSSISISTDKTKEARIADAALRRKKSEIQTSHPHVKLYFRNQKLIVKDGSVTTTLCYDPSTNDVHTVADDASQRMD